MIPNKILFVGGTFDDSGGRPSRIVQELAYGLYTTINGGTYKDLEFIIDNHIKDYSCIIWMPNINNKEKKLLPKIKEQNPKIVLISSKRNENKKYKLMKLIERTLKSKSQLMIEISVNKNKNNGWREEGEEKKTIRLLDPLGNVSRFYALSEIKDFRNKLYERIMFLMQMRRVKTKMSEHEEEIRPDINTKFLDAIKSYADTFHTLIHGEQKNPRFLGNTSFRCTKGGFPSVRLEHNEIYVSKRNVDKRSLGNNNFVLVGGSLSRQNYITAHGYEKPSVDTPVQLSLYEAFPQIKYMLHAHVYHKDGLFTQRYVPCGDLREVDEILRLIQKEPNCKNFIINLRGHGCLLASSNVQFMLNQEKNFYARPIPEENL